jgi:hypothetical protein
MQNRKGERSVEKKRKEWNRWEDKMVKTSETESEEQIRKQKRVEKGRKK